MKIRNTLLNLAELHLMFGFIGIDEFHERIEVALWLDDENDSANDPRCEEGDGSSPEKEPVAEGDSVEMHVERKPSRVTASQAEEDDTRLEFLCLGVWIFTKSDPDSYPSVPHGHYKNKNTRWPKLNPYTGRVFSSKHAEDTSKRLTKNQMRIIWRDENFRNFCREMVVWYREQFPYFEFPTRRPLKMPIW